MGALCDTSARVGGRGGGGEGGGLSDRNLLYAWDWYGLLCRNRSAFSFLCSSLVSNRTWVYCTYYLFSFGSGASSFYAWTQQLRGFLVSPLCGGRHVWHVPDDGVVWVAFEGGVGFFLVFGTTAVGDALQFVATGCSETWVVSQNNGREMTLFRVEAKPISC